MGVVDSELPEKCQRLLVFDALGDGPAVEALREVDDGFDYVLICGVRHEVADELDVDLQSR